MATSVTLEENLTHPEEGTSGTKLKIALVGETGSGKSSFINAIRGLEDDDIGAAETFDQTVETKVYPHPLNSAVTLWDHPGLDTTKHADAKAYLKTFYLERFDAFLLFVKGKYTKTDQDLAKKLHSLKKPFFVIRTNIDNDLVRARKSNMENTILQKMRENALEMLSGLTDSEGDKKLYLISNRLPEEWDFDRLKKAILYELQPSQGKKCLPSKDVKECIETEIKAIDKARLIRDLRKKMEDFAHELKERGVDAATKKIEASLEKWKNDKVSLAIIGNSGVGKSSLINALRGIKDDAPNAAKTGALETTMEIEEYPYPKNENITLCDLPGIGSEKYPDLKAYCKKINLRKFDEFLMITATRFTNNDVQLAKKLKSMNKPFFFVRTKIDVDCQNESTKKSFEKTKMLEEIKTKCSKNLKSLCVDTIFLISNKHPREYDFPLLVEAILNKLSLDKQVCFILSLYVVSESILKGKVKRLRGRIWKVALLSVLKKIGPADRGRKYALNVIKENVKEYIDQLEFPEKDSEDLKNMSKSIQESVKDFYSTNEIGEEDWLERFAPTNSDNNSPGSDNEGQTTSVENEVDEMIKNLPWLDDIQAKAKPFSFVYFSLTCVLEKMESVSLEILREKIAKGLSFKYGSFDAGSN